MAAARENGRTMQRRLLLAAAAAWPAARLLAQQDSETRPRQKISAAALFEALSARFPLRLGVPGLLQLDVSAPRLLLLPKRNQLGAALLAEASGPALQVVPPPGELDLVFSLRYEAADRTLRAVRPEILDLRLPGLLPDTVQAMRALLPALMRDLAGEFVLHRFSERQLALPDTMGFAPEQLTVLDDGLLVVFGPKH
jgi:hypothetical protein